MKKRSRLLAIIISFFLIVAIPVYFVFIAPMLGQEKVVAASRVITIDINPSVQLTVDADNKVLDAKALNEEAEVLLSKLNLLGLQASEAVQLIVGAAVVLGYLDAAATDNYVAIGVEDNGDESTDDERQLESDLKVSAEKGLADHESAGEIDVSGIAHERITAAATLGISPGRLNLIDRLAEALGLTREDVLAQYGEANVKTLMKALKAAASGDGPTEPPSPSPSDPTEVPLDSSVTSTPTGGEPSATSPAADEVVVTATPTKGAKAAPTKGATAAPTKGATAAPTKGATAAPTAVVTAAPTAGATATPTSGSTPAPTAVPTLAPTLAPTVVPTPKPTIAPTVTPDVTGGATGT